LISACKQREACCVSWRRPVRDDLAFLTSTLSSAAGGLAASVPHLAHGLARASASVVHVVGVGDPEDPEAAMAWGPNVHADRAKGPHAFGYAPEMADTLARLAPSLIDVQGLWTYPSLANLRHHRRHGTPYVVTPHGMLDPWARSRSMWKKRAVRLLFEDAHLACAACLRATAEMEGEHFRNFGLTNPIAIVPNGVEMPALIQPERPHAGPRRLLFLSRIHPKKGLAYLLRAWSKIEVMGFDWDLMIAGPDEVNHKAEMQALARELGLRRVAWVDAVQGSEKSALYFSADLFVLPTHAENFGLVVAEALAHGVPVITTRNAPWKGLETHRCGWWISLNERTLIKTLARAMSLPSGELKEMGARGRAWMERDFGWDRIVAQMLEVYAWVRDGGNPPSFVHR